MKMMRILTQTDFSNNVNGIVAAATTTIATARATNSFVSVGPKTIQPVGATRISDKCRLPPTPGMMLSPNTDLVQMMQVVVV